MRSRSNLIVGSGSEEVPQLQVPGRKVTKRVRFANGHKVLLLVFITVSLALAMAGIGTPQQSVLLESTSSSLRPTEDSSSTPNNQSAKPFTVKENEPMTVKENNERDLLDPIDCKKLLKDFLMDRVESMKTVDERLYMSKTTTDPPFIVSTHSKDFDPTRWTIFTHGKYYETNLSWAVVEIMDETKEGEKVFLDVGGNIGWFSLLARSRGAKVYTFEPNEQNIVRYCQSLQINDWLHDDRSLDGVEVYDRGVNDIHGAELELWAAQIDNPGSFSFDRHGDGILMNIGGKSKMKLVTLDEWAKKKGIFESQVKISLMKVDVEGLEDRVFKGARKLLQSKLVENLVFEYVDTKHTEEDKFATMKFLYESGYVLHKHGGYKGPDKKGNSFKSWKEVADGLKRKKIGENLWFKLGM